MGALAIISAYAAMIWIGIDIAKRETSGVLRLVVVGVMATFSIQAVINLMVVTGLGPTKGIALPLLSSGGTGWIVTSICLGLVVAIERTQEYATAYDGSLEEDISFAQRGGMSLGLALQGREEPHEIGAQEMAELMGETGFGDEGEAEVVVPKRKRFARVSKADRQHEVQETDEWFRGSETDGRCIKDAWICFCRGRNRGASVSGGGDY